MSEDLSLRYLSENGVIKTEKKYPGSLAMGTNSIFGRIF
jgi:hypothetical protein